jgi:hypothetical protein
MDLLAQHFVIVLNTYETYQGEHHCASVETVIVLPATRGQYWA